MERLFAVIPIFVLALVLNGVNAGRNSDVHAHRTTHAKPNYFHFALNGMLDIPLPPPMDPELRTMPSELTEGRYRRAAVAADAQECSTIGANIMRLGGSAVDAAIAAIICTGVVNPQSCGIGGGHFLTYYNRASGQVYSVIGREQAPSAATEDMFTVDKNTSSRTGGKSIGVPGEILGLYEAWKLGGRLPWKQLFQPNIDLCRNGITVGRALRGAMMNTERFFEEFPAMKDYVTNPDTGEIYQEGEDMFRPRLANTLEVIANEGPNAFYDGSLTDDIIADISEADGIITKEDLAKYTAPVKQPVVFQLDETRTVFSPPLPSGGVVYQFILNVLKGFRFNFSSVATADEASTTWHRVVEAFKHAFSLRGKLGDNDIGSEEFIKLTDELVMEMTDPEFGETIRARISDKQTFETSYYDPELSGVYRSMGSTAHLSVLAPNGDAVSITSTINLSFGSKVVGTRTGIIFNDEMDDFSTPGTINFFGVPATPANFIVPGKRPLSSMCPSIIIDRWGDVQLVIGSAGGTRIITSTAQVTIETLLFNWGIKEAIDYRRVHHQLFPPTLGVQQGFPQILSEMETGKKKRFACDVCEKTYNTKARCSFHAKNQHEQSVESTICNVCNKRYSSADNLRKHQLAIHMGERRYPCTQCTSKFSSKRDLNEHCKQHHDGSIYECGNCKLAFGYKRSYKRHTSVCGKSRVRRSCTMCEKTFKTKDSLYHHMKAKHSNITYECVICGKTFERRYSYTRHMKNVHKFDY